MKRALVLAVVMQPFLAFAITWALADLAALGFALSLAVLEVCDAAA